MPQDNEYNGVERRRYPCRQCFDHPLVVREFEIVREGLDELKKTHEKEMVRVEDILGDRVKQSTFQWMFSAIGVVCITILGFIISLYIAFGDVRTELATSMAVASATIELMEKQVDHIAKIQQHVTRFISDHSRVK
jgi:hypothetical protein